MYYNLEFPDAKPTDQRGSVTCLGHTAAARTRTQVSRFRVCSLCAQETVFDFREQKSPPPVFNKRRCPGGFQWHLRESDVGRTLRLKEMGIRQQVIFPVSVLLVLRCPSISLHSSCLVTPANPGPQVTVMPNLYSQGLRRPRSRRPKDPASLSSVESTLSKTAPGIWLT